MYSPYCACEEIHFHSLLQFKIQRDFTIVLVTVLSISTYYTYLVSDHERVMNQMGVVCNIFTIIFFASPLINMVRSLYSTHAHMHTLA